MLKNIIFDLDNTIIRDRDEDAERYKVLLRKYGYDEEKWKELYDYIGEYDFVYPEDKYYYNRKEMLEYLNNSMRENYSIEFIDDLISFIGENWIDDVILDESILKNLSEKYNLYIYSNFYEEAQLKRMEKIDYLKYFKKIFCADTFGRKQSPKAFEGVLEFMGATADECIFIGDSKKSDILAANNVGMKAILYDYDGTKDRQDIVLNNYTVIHDLKELLDIL